MYKLRLSDQGERQDLGIATQVPNSGVVPPCTFTISEPGTGTRKQHEQHKLTRNSVEIKGKSKNQTKTRTRPDQSKNQSKARARVTRVDRTVPCRGTGTRTRHWPVKTKNAILQFLLVFQVGENDAESDPRGENRPKKKSHLTRKNLGCTSFVKCNGQKTQCTRTSMVCICQPLQCDNTTMTTLTNPKMTWVAQGLVLIGIPTRVSNSTLH